MDDVQLSANPATVTAPAPDTPSAAGVPAPTRGWRLPAGIAALGLLIIGADVEHYGWMRPALWLAQVPLLALLCYRLVSPAARSRGAATTATRYGFALISAAAVIAVVAIVATGHADTVVQSIQ